MYEIAGHIKNLLGDHDCVVIPGFGGFVTHPQGAILNTSKKQITPPQKVLGFNPMLIKNDGLLAHHISISDNIDYSESLSLINEYVDLIKVTLNKNNQFVLEEIGTLYKDVNGILRFRQLQTSSFDISTFGLEPVRAFPIVTQLIKEVTPIAKAETANPVVPILSDQKDSEPKLTPVKEAPFPWKRLAIAACTLPFVFYLTWLGLFTNLVKNNAEFQYSDFNPFTEKICYLYEPRGEVPAVVNQPEPAVSTLQLAAKISTTDYIQHSFISNSDKRYHDKKSITVKIRNFVALPVTTLVSSFDKNLFRKHDHKGFFLITGCFQQYENALNHVDKLRKSGFKAQIVDQRNGLFRVSASNYHSKVQAQDQLIKLKNSGFTGAWILRKS